MNVDDRTNEKYQSKISELEQENQIKGEELHMRNREIEMLHANFERKFGTFENTNSELESQLEFRERELLEERLKREELENEIKRYKEEMEDYSIKETIGVRYGIKDNYPENTGYISNPNVMSDSTYLDSKTNSKDHNFGNIYGKLSSELSNLRNEINNMKSDRCTYIIY
jgi:hypothetical protein